MSASSIRRRLSLLSGGSLLAALVMAGAGGVALAPTVALAANECVPTSPTLAAPGDNGATSDTYVCAGSYPSVTYTTNGAFTLRLQNNVTTTTGGVTIIGATGNNVTVNRLADSPADSGDPSLTSTSGPALWVTNTGGGNISVSLNDNDSADTPMTIAGVNAGVLVHNANGAGSTSFSSNNGTIIASAGSAVDVTSASTGNVTVTNGSALSASAYGIRAGAGAGNLTITNNGQINAATGAILVTGGANATINNNGAGLLNGSVTVNNSGTVNFTNNGRWAAGGTSALGSGATTLTNGAIGRIVIGGAATFDFAAGTDTWDNAGVLQIGTDTGGPATLTLLGLEAWDNSGLLLFGADAGGLASDGVANDRIVASGTLFTGSGDSAMMIMDVNPAGNQASCAAAVYADCLDLRGSSTAGSTSIFVNLVSDPTAAVDRLVLVDVAGSGASGADHFTLHKDNIGYRPIGAGGAIERGFYFYGLEYDAPAKQHALRVGFSRKALEVAHIGRAASEPWRTATGMWRDRQLDLRDDTEGPGAWIRVAKNIVTQTGRDVIDLKVAEVAYNMGLAQDTSAIVGGVDLMRMYTEDSTLVFGLTAGKLKSTLEYRAATSDLELEGYSFGAYASLVGGRMLADVIVNSTNLDLAHNDLGRTFTGAAKSIGFQLEGGYRLFEVNGGVHLEPIVALSYVRTEVDDLDLGPVSATFDDASSTRAALGLRVSGDLESEAVTARLAFTSRFWKELDGEHNTTLTAPFGKADFTDTDIDTLGDVGLALSLFRPGGRLSADVGYSLKFGEGYKSSDAGVSVRLRW